MSECALCNPLVIERQRYYEGEAVCGLIDYKPITEGHALIVPRRHVERFEELSPEEWVEIFDVVQKTHRAAEALYGKSDYLLLQKNGRGVGQTVPHVHFHYVRHTPSPGWWAEIRWFLRFFIPWLIPVLTVDEQNTLRHQLAEHCPGGQSIE